MNENFYDETTNSKEETMLSKLIYVLKDSKNFSLIAIYLLIVVFPLLFVPIQFGSLIGTKLYFLYLIVFAVLIHSTLGLLKKVRITLPANLFSYILFGIGGVSLLSSFFTDNYYISLFSRHFSLASSLTIIVLILLSVIVAFSVSSRKHIFSISVLFSLVFVIWFIIHATYLIFAGSLPNLNFFFSSISNTIGSIVDISYFAGLVILLSSTMLIVNVVDFKVKILLYTSLILSLATLFAVNNRFIWIIIAFVSLILFISLMSFGRKYLSETLSFPSRLLIISIISFIAILASGPINLFVDKYLNIGYLDVRPSFTATLEIAKESYVDDPILGAGPNMFERAWNKYKPDDINQTLFWSNNFGFGYSTILTFMINTGIIGVLLWLTFLVLMLYYSFKVLSANYQNGLQFITTLSVVISTLYLWLLMFTTAPGPVIITFAFLFLGLFMYELYSVGLLPVYKINIEEIPQYGFIYVTILVAVLASSVFFAYRYSVVYVAGAFFNHYQIERLTNGVNEKSINYLNSAYTLNPIDVYSREYALIGLNDLNIMVRTMLDGQQVNQAAFGQLVSDTLGFATVAVNYDSYDISNTLLVARIYHVLDLVKVEGARDSAENYLMQSEEKHPNNPTVPFVRAQMAYELGDSQKSEEYLAKSLELKPSYVEALIFLSDKRIAEGDIEQAILAALNAFQLNPNDAVVSFRLGFLYFSDGQYENAALAFDRAIALDNQFYNAWYYLGLSLRQLGQNDLAKNIFQQLSSAFPDSEDIRTLLEDIDAPVAPLINEEENTESDGESLEESEELTEESE